MSSGLTQLNNPETQAANGRFFDVAFDPDSAVDPAEVNPVDAGLFIADFYVKYKPVMPYDTALLNVWGVNENSDFFDRREFKIKGEPDPGKDLRQTVMLGLVWPQNSETPVSWQVSVVDRAGKAIGPCNRLHSLFHRLNGEWFGVSRNFDKQLRETGVENLSEAATANLYRAVRYLLSKSEVEQQAETLRRYQQDVAPQIAELDAPKRSGKPLTVEEVLLRSELVHIGFPPVPWRRTAPPPDLQ